MKFNVIEICAGVGGFGLGFGEFGHVLCAVEWDKAAAGVYQYNNPEVEMFSDLTKIEATDLPWDADNLVICGGTPCQAFSVAGKRGSLSDDRGNLALTFNNLCDAIDDLRLNAGKEPAIILWENVCGAINTDDNAFGCILAGMAGSDSPLVPVGEQRWTNSGMVVGPRRNVAFRVLDSQYFGVAQRRRRIFAVAIGGSRKWAAPEALIPFQKSLPRNPKKGESSVEGSPGNAGSSATGTGPVSTGKDPQTMSSICATDSKKYYSNQWVDEGKMIAQGADVYNGEITGETAATVTSATGIANAGSSFTGTSVGKYEEGVGTLRSQGGDLGGGSETLAVYDARGNGDGKVPCTLTGDHQSRVTDYTALVAQGADVYNGEITGETAATVTSATGIANASGPKVLSFASKQQGMNVDDVANTLASNDYKEPQAVVSWNGDVTPKAAEDVSVTLRSQQGGEGVGVAHGPEGPCYENHPGDSRVTDSGELAPTLTKRNGTGGGNLPFIKDSQNLTVRRLSSVECMRLQGWPDTHCDFKMELEPDGNRWKPTGKVVKQAEGPKYKQAGNGVTANVIKYIAEKLANATK